MGGETGIWLPSRFALPAGTSAQRWAARSGQLAAALRREVQIADLGGGRVEITVVDVDAMGRVPSQPHPLGGEDKQ
jgi:hypothetical protein